MMRERKSFNVIYSYYIFIKVLFINFLLFKVMEEIGIDHIDTLILSLPDKIFNQAELSKEIVLPLWTYVTKLVQSKIISTAGVADFSAKYLEQLTNILEDKNVTSFNKSRTSIYQVKHFLIKHYGIPNYGISRRDLNYKL